jgi:hypothetical protein
LLGCQGAITEASMAVIIFCLFEPTTEYLRTKFPAASVRLYICSTTKAMASSLNSLEYFLRAVIIYP